jgi:hypothetical protein
MGLWCSGNTSASKPDDVRSIRTGPAILRLSPNWMGTGLLPQTERVRVLPGALDFRNRSDYGRNLAVVGKLGQPLAFQAGACGFDSRPLCHLSSERRRSTGCNPVAFGIGGSTPSRQTTWMW